MILSLKNKALDSKIIQMGILDIAKTYEIL